MSARPKRIFKFNNGNGAVLCSCGVILYTGSSFTEEEWEAVRGDRKGEPLPPLYCEDCKKTLKK